MKDHHLQLNIAKTELLVVSANRSFHHNFTFQLGSSTITPSKTARNLGVVIDDKLNLPDHITKNYYCNALLGGCPASSINKLQIVQNAAARVLTRSRKYDHITPILQSLHWLPIKFRISYKILLLAYKALNDLAPAYLTNLLSRYNLTRSLRNKTLDSW